VTKAYDVRGLEGLQNLTLQDWEEYAEDAACAFEAALLYASQVHEDPRQGKVREHILRQAAEEKAASWKYFCAIMARYRAAGGKKTRWDMRLAGGRKFSLLVSRFLSADSSSSKP
jgi:hypothetical protein